ncbi:MAG: thioredoxin-dependent thiol peroxidase [Alphaproteobacteria bacterium]|nr:thioredoxin-dependent thiol peroxidase [Alphaproteobacteria bacterium]
MSLNIGDAAPDFRMPAAGGTSVALSDFRGRKLVLYFYPRDNTLSCTKEAQAFQDAAEDFERAGAAILGVSPDAPIKHDRFKAKYGLTFSLGSDEDNAVASAYGVWVKKQMYGRSYMGIERSTFLIDKDGRIAGIWRQVRVKDHAQTVLDTLIGD